MCAKRYFKCSLRNLGNLKLHFVIKEIKSSACDLI